MPLQHVMYIFIYTIIVLLIGSGIGTITKQTQSYKDGYAAGVTSFEDRYETSLRMEYARGKYDALYNINSHMATTEYGQCILEKFNAGK